MKIWKKAIFLFLGFIFFAGIILFCGVNNVTFIRPSGDSMHPLIFNSDLLFRQGATDCNVGDICDFNFTEKFKEEFIEKMGGKKNLSSKQLEIIADGYFVKKIKDKKENKYYFKGESVDSFDSDIYGWVEEGKDIEIYGKNYNISGLFRKK